MSTWRGFEVTRVEPSQRFRRSAAAKGLTVHPSYVTRDSAVPDAPYDAVVSRLVLDWCLTSKAFSPACGFFPDNVNYFSAATLASVWRRNGLAASRIVPTLESEDITAFVSPASDGTTQASPPSRPLELSALEEFLLNRKVQGQLVAAWGRGGKGISRLAAASALDGIAYVVDGDPCKQGLYQPVSHFEIHSPDRWRPDPVNCVLVTAIAHASEIEDILRDDLGSEGTIALLGDRIDEREKGEAPAIPGDRK